MSPNTNRYYQTCLTDAAYDNIRLACKAQQQNIELDDDIDIMIDETFSEFETYEDE